MAEIDEQRVVLRPREIGAVLHRAQLRHDAGDARAVVEDAAVADHDEPARARISSSATSFAVSSGLMPAGSPIASAMSGFAVI